MPNSSTFYSTYMDEIGRHPFDLEYAGIKRFVSFLPAQLKAGATPTATPLGHYDKAFIKAFLEVCPIQEGEEFLEHHYEYYRAQKGARPYMFVRHLEKTVLPALESIRDTTYTPLLQNWIKAQRENLALKRNLPKKDEELGN